MTITLNNVGKRFNREWIFRGISCAFEQGEAYAIVGPNGSGKSTLLQLVSGALNFNEGKIEYRNNNASITEENIYRHISIAAPYLELVEEMTATEFLHFHSSFKPLDKSAGELLAIAGLSSAANKQIRYYSSGMKQRLKLAQAVFSQTPVLLLDEPCTNLDAEGTRLYQQLIAEHCKGKIILVSSNDEAEYGFCKKKINISDYKRGD